MNSLPYALASAPGWLFAGLGDGGIYASDDGGDRWRALVLHGDRLPRINALAWAIYTVAAGPEPA